MRNERFYFFQLNMLIVTPLYNDVGSFFSNVRVYFVDLFHLCTGQVIKNIVMKEAAAFVLFVDFFVNVINSASFIQTPRESADRHCQVNKTSS